MARVTVIVDWDGDEHDAIEVVEERARRILKLYGFCSVSLSAFRGKVGMSLELTGPRKDVQRAKDLFQR